MAYDGCDAFLQKCELQNQNQVQLPVQPRRVSEFFARPKSGFLISILRRRSSSMDRFSEQRIELSELDKAKEMLRMKEHMLGHDGVYTLDTWRMLAKRPHKNRRSNLPVRPKLDIHFCSTKMETDGEETEQCEDDDYTDNATVKWRGWNQHRSLIERNLVGNKDNMEAISTTEKQRLSRRLST